MVKRNEDILALTALAAVIVGCLLVLAPFLSAILWAVVICFSTWGIYERLLALVRGREILAALLMTCLLAALVLGPLIVVATSLGENTTNLARAIQRWAAAGPPEPPEWLARVPLIGATLRDYWAAFDMGKLVAYLRDLAAPLGRFALGTGLALGQGVLWLALGVLITFFLYRDGLDVAAHLRAGMERIAGARAHHLLAIAGNTVKGVVYGIIFAALAQGVMAGLGYWIAGVPGPFLLGLVTCILALIPWGPPLIWVPATVWLFREGHPGWAIFMGIWGITAISSIDNILRPYLISLGSRLPFLLTLLGVVGGVLRFGIIGVFLGPTLLAVGYALLSEWTRTARARRAAASAPAASIEGEQASSSN
jgi:predicted PurR-regulated permease PerM